MLGYTYILSLQQCDEIIIQKKTTSNIEIEYKLERVVLEGCFIRWKRRYITMM